METDSQQSATVAKPEAQGTLAALTGSEVKCKCFDCGKEIIYSTIKLCDDCYNYRCDVEMQEDDGLCDRCNGEGQIMVCIDDICHGLGECIHGDGYAACPTCKGTGERPRANPPNHHSTQRSDRTD